MKPMLMIAAMVVAAAETASPELAGNAGIVGQNGHTPIPRFHRPQVGQTATCGQGTALCQQVLEEEDIPIPRSHRRPRR